MAVTRYKITTEDGICRCYYHSIEEAKLNWADALAIEEDHDTSFLEYVEKIKARADKINGNYWSFDLSDGLLMYYQYTDEGKYLDGGQCRMKTHDYCPLQLGWDLTNPKKFYDTYLKDELSVNDQTSTRMSKREFSKLKPKPTKLTKDFYVDELGRFYYVPSYMWSKKFIDRWNEYKDDEAPVTMTVHGELNCPINGWYHSKEEAVEAFDEYNKNWKPIMGTLWKDIKFQKVTQTHPYDKPNIVRLPYINIKAIQDYSILKIMQVWFRALDKSYYFHEVCECRRWDNLEEATKKYLEKLKNNA